MSHPKDQKLCGVNEMPADPQIELGETNKIDPRQADLAAAYLNNTEQHDPLSLEHSKRVKRKMDWVLLPMVRTDDTTTWMGANIL